MVGLLVHHGFSSQTGSTIAHQVRHQLLERVRWPTLLISTNAAQARQIDLLQQNNLSAPRMYIHSVWVFLPRTYLHRLTSVGWKMRHHTWVNATLNQLAAKLASFRALQVSKNKSALFRFIHGKTNPSGAVISFVFGEFSTRLCWFLTHCPMIDFLQCLIFGNESSFKITLFDLF